MGYSKFIQEIRQAHISYFDEVTAGGYTECTGYLRFAVARGTFQDDMMIIRDIPAG